jgi:hypothetical protein
VNQFLEVPILVEEGGEAQLLDLSSNGLSHVKLTAINVNARKPVPQELYHCHLKLEKALGW